MILVKHRIKPNRNGPAGIVTLQRIEAGAPVWRPDPGKDKLLEIDGLRSLTEIEFEALLIMGRFIRLPYSRLWVIGGDLFGAMQTSSHKLESNLRSEFDTLVAADTILPRHNQQLIAPAEFDVDRSWKCRVFKSGGWQRQGDSVAAKPSLAAYLRYVERQG